MLKRGNENMSEKGERERWEHLDRGNEGGRREDRNDWLREKPSVDQLQLWSWGR